MAYVAVQRTRKPWPTVRRAVVYALLAGAGLATVGPFYWEYMLASHTTAEIANTPPPVWVGHALVQNYATLIEYAPYFWRSLLNSGIIGVGSTVVTAFFSALSGYAFARHSFPGKEKLFWLLLMTMHRAATFSGYRPEASSREERVFALRLGTVDGGWESVYHAIASGRQVVHTLPVDRRDGVAQGQEAIS